MTMGLSAQHFLELAWGTFNSFKAGLFYGWQIFAIVQTSFHKKNAGGLPQILEQEDCFT